MNIDDMTCEWFESQLSAYLEDDLAADRRADMERHLIACDACTALVSDLRALSVDAHTLPDLVPSRDLWEGIATRIEAPVIGIDSVLSRPAGRISVRRTSSASTWGARAWMGAAAAGLVAMTAGVTYLATKRAYDDRVVVAQATAPSVTTPATVAASSPSSVPSRSFEPANENGAPDAGAVPRAAASGVRTVGLARTAAEQTYDVEIARLRQIVNTRRSRLDPYTVSVIEKSLSVIDQAIAESRAALARDPASGFLTEQLNSALDKKVQLLRTAAMLPAHT